MNREDLKTIFGHEGEVSYVDSSYEEFLEEVKKNFHVYFLCEGWRGKIFVVECTETTESDAKTKKFVVKVPRYPDLEENIKREAEILRVVNKDEIGPRLFAVGKNFFVAEFIEGTSFREILKKHDKIKREFISYLRDILFQARRLDIIGVSKDEMHKPYSNVIVRKSDGKVILIDFESAGLKERPKNTTQFFSFFVSFMKHKGVMFPKDEEKAIEIMKEYKRTFSDESFRKIVSLFDEVSLKFLKM